MSAPVSMYVSLAVSASASVSVSVAVSMCVSMCVRAPRRARTHERFGVCGNIFLLQPKNNSRHIAYLISSR